MEEELKRHLLACADAFCGHSGRSEATVASNAAGDWRFFDRLRGKKSFLASKYDSVMRWFAGNWPADAAWPADVPRPTPPAPSSHGEAA